MAGTALLLLRHSARQMVTTCVTVPKSTLVLQVASPLTATAGWPWLSNTSNRGTIEHGHVALLNAFHTSSEACKLPLLPADEIEERIVKVSMCV